MTFVGAAMGALHLGHDELTAIQRAKANAAPAAAGTLDTV